MILQFSKARRKHVLIDIDTQRDYLLAEGSVCVRNHRRVLAHIRRVMAWARARHVPVISTAEVHPNDNSNGQPAHCLDGTIGQKKIRYTLVPNRISFAADGNTDLPREILRQYDQIILHKRCLDPFDEPRIERLLTEVRANEFILIGVTAEGAVAATALGLLQRGKRVTIVADAVGAHNRIKAEFAFRKVQAKGARLIETRRLAGLSHLRLVGTCCCDSCRGLSRKVVSEVSGGRLATGLS